MTFAGSGARTASVAALVLAAAGQAALAAPRDDLLRSAEAALARGDAAVAADDFERAATMLHAADTEMGLVRAAMQAGRYRQALAFCAHVAGGHLESPAAGALYAWLLRAGGQPLVADRVLADTLLRSPSDAVATAVQSAFAGPWPVARGVLLDAPHRMAPEDFSRDADADRVPADWRVASSGVLVAGGSRALVPRAAVTATAAGRLWVRNGLGDASAAVLDDDPLFAALGIAVLRLERTLPFAVGDAPAGHDPYAGSPGFVVEYAAADGGRPAWPWLRQGFIGAASRDGVRRLGIDIADGPHGGLVMDGQGRVAGIARRQADGSAAFVPVSLWGEAAGGAAVAPTAAAGTATAPRSIAADEAYERALRLTLQVIVPP